MNLKSILGRNIRQYRRTKKWSQERLGTEANLTTSYISQVERGEKNASVEVVQKLSSALNISPKKLLDYDDNHVLDLTNFYELVDLLKKLDDGNDFLEKIILVQTRYYFHSKNKNEPEYSHEL